MVEMTDVTGTTNAQDFYVSKLIMVIYLPKASTASLINILMVISKYEQPSASECLSLILNF